ncbi:cation:proton antiporter [Sphingomonas sp.]|uniref:cation:proton antiporter domain-containing protein n=1 Tax=Sphingomonas sp. TaxID=28214 RepID=UPI0025E65548|nr:cation:proton antiporter [Sphingomonas sp.]
MLLTGAFMLGAALIFVTLFRKLGLGATLGYIVGGAMIGPQALRLVGDPEAVMRVSEIGIAFLLFLVGLELHPSRLWRLRKDIFGLGLIQVVLCGLVLSALIYVGLDFSIQASLALGLPLGLSSTAQVLPMLRSSGQFNTRRGERAFSVLLFQDLSIVPMITIIAAMSRAPVDPDQPSGAMLALYTVAAIVGLVLAGRFILNPLFRLVGRLGERELFVVAGLFAVIASASLMHTLHLSVALGAFVAGVVLAESPYRHELESDVEPFRSILLGMFFLSVGMLLDLTAIASDPLFVMGAAAALILVKALLITGLARMFGVRMGRAIWLGLLLSQAGEFGFVLFVQASAARLIAPEVASLFSAIVTVSMIATPFLMRLTEWVLERMPEPEAGHQGPEFSPETNAIVVGYGRFGQTVAQMLMAKRIPVTIVDRDSEQIEVSEGFGTKVYYGDGTRIDLLRTAGAETAEAILFCHDDRDLTREKLEAILEAFPQAQVLVRAYDRRHVMALDGLDVALIQRELFESAVLMGREALLKLGIARREADRVETAYRQRDSERLERQSATGDLRAARDRMFGVDSPLPDEQSRDPA